MDKYVTKFAAAKASSSVVTLITRNISEEMVVNFSGYTTPTNTRTMSPPNQIMFLSSGIVVECQRLPTATANYLCTILAPASLFKRPADICIAHIDTDVFVAGGVLHKGRPLACDFHYNLAVVTIETDIPLQAANLRSIDDTLSIHPTHHLHSPSFQLRPHSHLFKMLPHTQLVTVSRSFADPCHLLTASATFISKRPQLGFVGTRTPPTVLTCNELYEIKIDDRQGIDGEPVVNCLGEIVGIFFYTSSFLPSNIISRWWSHYKSSGEFRRPIIGMEVVNLYDTDVESIAHFITKFPGISSAVVVSKVNEDSPASRSGICTDDVIVKLDGKPVLSKLKFYELVWENAGKSVELDVLRITNGEKLNLSLVIENASPEKFHQWSDPYFYRMR